MQKNFIKITFFNYNNYQNHPIYHKVKDKLNLIIYINFINYVHSIIYYLLIIKLTTYYYVYISFFTNVFRKCIDNNHFFYF